MKRALTLLILLTALGVSPGAAQKVYVDFDESVDFNQFQTFAWARTSEVSLLDTSPLMHSRVKNAIEYQLTTSGLIEDTENPDLYVTYYGEEEEQLSVSTTHWGYGWGGSWAWDPYWGPGWGASTGSSMVRTYPVGTLIVDLWNVQTQQLIWRGSATKAIPSDPEKQAKLIDKAVAKIARAWKKKYRRSSR